MDKAAGLLDLSQVPPAARDEVAVDTLFLLREVVAQIELPDWANFRILDQALWKWIALLLAAKTDVRFFRAAM